MSDNFNMKLHVTSYSNIIQTLYVDCHVVLGECFHLSGLLFVHVFCICKDCHMFDS